MSVFASADSYTAQSGIPLTVAAPGVMSNDFLSAGNVGTVTLFTSPSHGAVALNADGSFIYTSTAGYVGTDSFQYRLTGSLGGGPMAQNVTITVIPAPGGIFHGRVKLGGV